MKIAIITGASSGLGEKFLYEAGKRFSLDEIWIIARRKERLEALAAKCTGGAKIVPVPLDLCDYASYEALSAMLAEKKPEIFALINNAGFGKLGNMADMTYPDQAGMVDLNCRALTAVTTICLPYMKRRAGKEKAHRRRKGQLLYTQYLLHRFFCAESAHDGILLNKSLCAQLYEIAEF